MPIGGKKLLTFMDDFNMPAKDTFGSQPPLELIKQWIDYSFWYDRQKQIVKHIKVGGARSCGVELGHVGGVGLGRTGLWGWSWVMWVELGCVSRVGLCGWSWILWVEPGLCLCEQWLLTRNIRISFIFVADFNSLSSENFFLCRVWCC